MKLTSTAFLNNEQIPTRYTCDGSGLSPPLEINAIPHHTHSLALVTDDINASDSMGYYVHWLMWNIHPHTTFIKEGVVPTGAVLGKTSFGVNHYTPLCPVKGKHTYRFRLFALTKNLALNPDATVTDLEEEIAGHIIEEVEYYGTYHRLP